MNGDYKCAIIQNIHQFISANTFQIEGIWQDYQYSERISQMHNHHNNTLIHDKLNLVSYFNNPVSQRQKQYEAVQYTTRYFMT
ncbi:hypothetical protein [uncultured Candidatus Kuenenia sp.]|uniref:hypothetical protein n=1 Tax=Candidatus Kuenenia sp. TaxID=2499824 RepID=UPI001DD6A552|nr:hypothetical protein [uncultured Candidatus Kuenenia sp.]MBE7547858.1 hypothetical protein [Planctomycetia bacterium]